jgi:hypothetical protein
MDGYLTTLFIDSLHSHCFAGGWPGLKKIQLTTFRLVQLDIPIIWTLPLPGKLTCRHQYPMIFLTFLHVYGWLRKDSRPHVGETCLKLLGNFIFFSNFWVAEERQQTQDLVVTFCDCWKTSSSMGYQSFQMCGQIQGMDVWTLIPFAF